MPEPAVTAGIVADLRGSTPGGGDNAVHVALYAIPAAGISAPKPSTFPASACITGEGAKPGMGRWNGG